MQCVTALSAYGFQAVPHQRGRGSAVTQPQIVVCVAVSQSLGVDAAGCVVRAGRTVAMIEAANSVIGCWGWSGP